MKTRTWSPLFVSGALAAAVSLIWIALAWRSPTSTFHFAPVIAAAAGPYAAKSAAGPLATSAAAAVAATSLGSVGLAVVALEMADRLQGPTFWSADGAVFEAAIFATIGALAGLGYLTTGHGEPAS